MSKQNQTLEEFINSLPEEERIVLTLYFVKRYSIEEISAKIGAPERSVKAVLSSGRMRMSSAFNFPQGS
ncbi:MAG: sigma-70 family RNA polymerase sigma factor [Actinobacteria bacterium]|nr:sigma-70 family RNA polymerase sigma factor [Actinomycetota bacterium]NBO47110.1 sigma-70 family RNA polymerase sigma factor [Actinomycetota bacterium]NBP12002.1 sigma-70 family RNA polymerase sigma factor [Actinomycetota bacterium]NBQ00455.1 sigma-70 family RNA polymerase sigma factor [Actinomycetota bacterium]NBY49913.1 sigma-70 family RNA polymerase sigma factor [Actinomycetota bacterium]